MTASKFLANAPDLSAEDYCVFGLATCFIREDTEIRPIQIVEPIPSAALEAILKGIPTSYQLACATSLRDIFVGDEPQLPTEFPQYASFCDDLAARTIAAARTYKKAPQAMSHIPLGTKREDFNYSTEKKRVLNSVNVVRAEDNIKQHSHTHKVL